MSDEESKEQLTRKMQQAHLGRLQGRNEGSHEPPRVDQGSAERLDTLEQWQQRQRQQGVESRCLKEPGARARGTLLPDDVQLREGRYHAVQTTSGRLVLARAEEQKDNQQQLEPMRGKRVKLRLDASQRATFSFQRDADREQDNDR